MRVDWVKMIMRAEGTVPVTLSVTISLVVTSSLSYQHEAEDRRQESAKPSDVFLDSCLLAADLQRSPLYPVLLLRRIVTFVRTELQLGRGAIYTRRVFNQFIVCARLHNHTSIDHKDPVCFADR
jgi:hypothetical protein